MDLDPQANLSQSLGLINQEKTIYGALKGNINWSQLQF
jgi:chromosome partitioning protein